MNNKVLKISALVLACAIFTFALVSAGRSSYKAYYSGDAVNYQDNLIVASTDSGNLEVFKLRQKSLDRVINLKSPNSPLDKADNFSSVKLNIEGGRLMAYATSGYTLYKYDISNLSNPVLYAHQKNTYYEWYTKVEKFGANIVTVSDKNVRIWKSDNNMLDVIDSYKIANDLASSVSFDASGRYITSINKDNLVRIFDTKTRTEITHFPVNYRATDTVRNTYFDPIAKELYVFDDYYLKRFDLKGNLLVSYPNSSNKGFAVEPSGNNAYVYAANGNSVLKLEKDNFKNGLKVSAFNLNSNGYAMGLKYVDVAGDDQLVVFNGGGISVLNASLAKQASVLASEFPYEPVVKEKLALAFDHYTATTGATVTLSGAGYLPGENININFGKSLTKITADGNGRFKQNLIVPASNVSRIDAKVDGLKSNLTYSVSFTVVK